MSPHRPDQSRRAFISHSTPDDGYVAEVESLVRAMGHDDVFNDSRSIEPDEQFWPEIVKGITDCDTFVVVITSASIKSAWVQREVDLARSLSKTVVPIWTEDCELPADFADRDVIDFRPEQTPHDLDQFADLQREPDLLWKRGNKEADIEGIMHGNWVRFFKEAWRK